MLYLHSKVVTVVILKRYLQIMMRKQRQDEEGCCLIPMESHVGVLPLLLIIITAGLTLINTSLFSVP